MTAEAEQARANAISLEVKKDALAQRQSGDWQIRFTVAAVDMDSRLTSAAMGTRFACVLVEINDDETPVHNKAKREWRELGEREQSVLRCNEPSFWAYLQEVLHYDARSGHAAAIAVRDHCQITSRSDLTKPHMGYARVLWHKLDNDYQAWKGLQRHG